MLFKKTPHCDESRLFCQDSSLKVVISILVFIPKQERESDWLGLKSGSKNSLRRFKLKLTGCGE